MLKNVSFVRQEMHFFVCKCEKRETSLIRNQSSSSKTIPPPPQVGSGHNLHGVAFNDPYHL